MSKITVSETVSRSIAVDNSIADVQTAITRCFQFLEERRFKEANDIIEQVLNIDPNNTDTHVANFLYQFELTSAEDVVENFKSCAIYENSVFYKRIKRSSPTELSKKLDFCLGQASEQLKKFNAEEKRRIQDQHQRNEGWRKKERNVAIIGLIIVISLTIIVLSAVCTRTLR